MRRKKCMIIDNSRRCMVKLQLLSVALFVFFLVHLQYIHSVSYDVSEKALLFPDGGRFSNFQISDVSSQRKSGKAVFRHEKTDEKPINATCSPRRSIVFLKTHKTGSTTMTNIILRYAEKHKLVVGLPPNRMWELAGYPATFNKKLIDPQLAKYDVLCHHFRMDVKEVYRVAAKNSVYITILRDPANAFESGFAFFRDGPYSSWIPDYQNASGLATFLSNPMKYYNRKTPWYFRAKNYHAFDLGFDNEREDDHYLHHVIRSMDNQYNLVMITERYDESLILLKDLLCMDSLEDVLHLRLKVRQDSTRRDADDTLREKMRAWNLLDTHIYEYYSRLLDRKIEAYGRERMKQEVQELDKMVQDVEKRCILEYDQVNLRPWISRIRLNKHSGELCEKLSWGEVKYGDYIRKHQLPYANIRPERQISHNEMVRLLGIEQRKFLS